MTDWVTDDNQVSGFINTFGNLVLGAYLLPDSTKFKSKYTYTNYITEALRLANMFLIDSATKMNPNINYGGIIPTGPYTATSAKDLVLDKKAYGRGVGMITLI